MLTQTALECLKIYLLRRIEYAQYQVDGAYHRAEIHNADILPDGRVTVEFIIDHTLPGDITVTKVQLLDRNGAVWAEKDVKILRRDAQEGILYRFRFTIGDQEEG